MKVKIILKNYGVGKMRIVLVNEDDGNLAFASYGQKDTEWGYLFDKFNEQEIAVAFLKCESLKLTDKTIEQMIGRSKRIKL